MTPEQSRIHAEEARQLLDNRAFKGAMSRVSEYLDQQTLSCDPDNQSKAQRIVIAKQLLAAIERELRKTVEAGQVAEVQMNEIEQKRGLLKRMMQR